jgi:hypothetical protein
MRIATRNVNDIRQRIASSSAWLDVIRPDPSRIAFSDNTLLQPAARHRLIAQQSLLGIATPFQLFWPSTCDSSALPFERASDGGLASRLTRQRCGAAALANRGSTSCHLHRVGWACL